MIGTIRKHQQWLWAIIILAIIVSFVVYFSPNSRNLLEDQGRDNFGTIKGKAITRPQYRDAAAEIELFYFLRFGKWPGREDAQQSGFDIERETYNRIVLVEKLKELNVQPTLEATAKWITDIFRSNEDQTPPMQRYKAFATNELAPHRLTSDDFYRFARHQVAQQHLISVFGLAGKLITPQEAESFYRRLNEPLSTEAVFFSATNYLGQVSSTPAGLQQFYTNNMAEYRLPERMQVSYVKWELTNFLAEADEELSKITNFSKEVDAAYFRQGANAFKDENGKPLSMEAAKNKMKEGERKRRAYALAVRKEANPFLGELMKGHDENNPFTAEDLEKLAKEKKLEVKTTPPFDLRNGTNQLNVPLQFVRAAFSSLSEDREKAILSEDGVYVIAVRQRFPSEIQPFEKVEKQVADDYRAEQSVRLAHQAGMAFDKAVTNETAKTFSEICAQMNVKAISLPEFSLSTRTLPELGGQATLDSLQNVAASLSPGKASSFVPTASGGFVLHLKSKLPVDEARMKTELPEFLARQREQRMSAAFGEWFQKLPQELKLAMPVKNAAGKS